jgi:hypothetical protein
MLSASRGSGLERAIDFRKGAQESRRTDLEPDMPNLSKCPSWTHSNTGPDADVKNMHCKEDCCYERIDVREFMQRRLPRNQNYALLKWFYIFASLKWLYQPSTNTNK